MIKEKCNLNEFTKEKRTILEDVIDNLYYIDNLKFGNITVNHFKILDKLNLITKDNLAQLLDILKNTPNIQNAKNYLMICLYNNLVNTNINKIIKKLIPLNQMKEIILQAHLISYMQTLICQLIRYNLVGHTDKLVCLVY